MKSKTPWIGVIVVFIVFSVIALQSGCSTTVEETSDTEQVQTQGKRNPNPLLCAILFLKLDCGAKNKATPHAVPEKEPISETITLETIEG
tara:strand:+ start:539 stop:808 length:270 start_codon:yes stop_codon:yes gene_type:complete